MVVDHQAHAQADALSPPPSGIHRCLRLARPAAMIVLLVMVVFFVATHFTQMVTAAGALGYADPRWIAVAWLPGCELSPRGKRLCASTPLRLPSAGRSPLN